MDTNTQTATPVSDNLTSIAEDNTDLIRQNDFDDEAAEKYDNAAEIVINNARKNDRAGIQSCLNEFQKTERLQIILDAERALIGELYVAAKDQLDPKSKSDRLVQIKQIIKTEPNTQLHQLWETNSNALTILEDTRIGLILPGTIEKLQTLYDQRYSTPTTFKDVANEEKLAENMILALAKIPENDQQFMSDVSDFLHLGKTEAEDWKEYIIKVNDTLHYLSILDGIIKAAKSNKTDELKISKDDVFKIAPFIVNSLALARSPLLQRLALSTEKKESTPVSPSQTTTAVSTLDVV